MIQKKQIDLQLRPEDQLMLYCARTEMDNETKDKIVSLVSQDLDWDYLISMASRHRLIPLLYVNLNSICPSSVPETILSQLKDHFSSNIHKNLLLTGELVKIMDLLESRDIKAFTYKGPLLASLAYDNIGFRQFGDIDILVDKSDAVNVKEILFKEGYELLKPLKIDDSLYMKLESEYQFVSANRGLVEINWNFEGSFFSFSRSPESLFSHMEIYPVSGFPVRTVSPENHLLMLSIHAAKHNWSRLSWLCDITEFIKGENIDWTKTLHRAEQLGVKRILLINLCLARDLWGLELPEKLSNQIQQDKSVQQISFKVKGRIFSESEYSWSLLEKFLLDLKKRENISNGIKDCINGLTKPTYLDFEELTLPSALFPLYRIIRPLLLIRRYGKGSI